VYIDIEVGNFVPAAAR